MFDKPPYFSLCSWGLLTLNVGCGTPADAASGEQGETTGVASALLRVDVRALLATDDVARLHFAAERVSCEGEAFEASTVVSEAPVAELSLSVPNPVLGGEPLAADSQHAFADELMALEPGCYDITLTPLGVSGEPSRGCAPASANAVRIYPELTTEVVLISQCQNPPIGLVDAVLAFNHPPRSSELVYVDGRFVPTCQPMRVCATASDPDGDPVELVWTASAESNTHFTAPVLLSSAPAAGDGIEQCVSIVPQEPGRFQFMVTAYDQAMFGGSLVRIESLLAEAGEPGTSHASTTFSFVASQVPGGSPVACSP